MIQLRHGKTAFEIGAHSRRTPFKIFEVVDLSVEEKKSDFEEFDRIAVYRQHTSSSEVGDIGGTKKEEIVKC